MMPQTFVWCFVLLLTVNADMLDVLRPKTVHIHKFESCKDHPEAVVVVKDVHLTFSNKVVMVSLKQEARENVDEGLKLKIILTRCKSREALDTCEKYQTVNVNQFCKLLNAEKKPWTPLVKLSDPPMGCPIKKGISVVKNGTFDGSAFSHLPISGWYWIVRTYVLGEKTDRVVFCVSLEGQIVPV